MYIHIMEVTNQMINSTNGRRLLVIIIVTMFILLAGVAMAGGECKGASCEPLPPKAQACEHAENNPHCNPDNTREPQPSPTWPPATRIQPTAVVPTREPQPSPTMPPIFPSPTSKPGYHKAPSIPFFTPAPTGDVKPCYPLTDLGPDDVALLIEAVAEGYSIIIVRDVLATSPDVMVIGND